MMIVIHAGDTLAAYTQAYPIVATQRPAACPGCRVAGRMTSLGRYPRRKPLEGRAEVPQPVWVRRRRQQRTHLGNQCVHPGQWQFVPQLPADRDSAQHAEWLVWDHARGWVWRHQWVRPNYDDWRHVR